MRDKSFDPDADASEGDQVVVLPESLGEPYIVSVHPNVAYVGEDFEYKLKIVDPDTELYKISAQIEEGPDWLYLKDSFTLAGLPQIGDDGSVKIVLRIDDGDNTVFEKYYLLVKSRE